MPKKPGFKTSPFSNESKLITGILLWDLSAAFNTFDANLFYEKPKIYGFKF
jgi:hypothetical protein